MLAEGASVPSLGLSNKAVFPGEQEREQQEKHVKVSRRQEEQEQEQEVYFQDVYPDSYFSKELSSKPPAEEALVQNTLWPEVQKLYKLDRLYSVHYTVNYTVSYKHLLTSYIK